MSPQRDGASLKANWLANRLGTVLATRRVNVLVSQPGRKAAATS